LLDERGGLLIDLGVCPGLEASVDCLHLLWHVKTMTLPAARISIAAAPNTRLALGALGVVFGDIGTSPLYAFRESFIGAHRLPIPRHQIKASRDKARQIGVSSRFQHQDEIEAAKACRYAVRVGQKNTVRRDSCASLASVA